MQDRDEDISNNPFFLHFRDNFQLLYQEAIKREWIVCIPSNLHNCRSLEFDENFVLSHVIQSDGDNLKTLADEPVQMENGLLKRGNNISMILFRESLYTNQGKISALCISNCKPQSSQLTCSYTTSTISPSQKKIIQETIKFVKQTIILYSKSTFLNMKSNRLEIFTDQVTECLSKMDARISSCVIFNTHDFILDFITVALMKDEEQLNRIRMNTMGVQVETDPPFPVEFQQCSDRALRVLEELSSKKTADEKKLCLKETVNTLSQTGRPAQMHADTLLVLFSHLIVYSNIVNWNAQLHFMKKFAFIKRFDYGEESYYLSTLEAAIVYLKSTSLPVKIQQGQPKDNYADDIFYLSCKGDAAKLEELVYGSIFKCHPLCTCQFCGIPLVVNGTASDFNGFTALHYACMNGHTDVTQILLQTVFKKDIETQDLTYGRTALQWAAYQGFQNCLLLLCHQNCNLGTADKEGNNALHLAVKNGHESCVKALLYFAEHAHSKLDVNARNKNGEGALHLAAKWGYASIVCLLMEWNADKAVVNCKKQTAASVALNSKISHYIINHNEQNNVVTPIQSSKKWLDIKKLKWRHI